MRRLSPTSLLTVVLLAVCLLGVATTPGHATDSELPERLADPQQVEPISAADFGKVLESHRGKAVLVNLWATWCIPCVQELPDLDLLQQRFADRGLVILAVSIDDPAKLEASVRPFFAERAPNLVSYLNTEADEFAFAETIDPDWIGALPTTFFFDREGKMVEQHAGRLLYKDLESKVIELVGPASP